MIRSNKIYQSQLPYFQGMEHQNRQQSTDDEFFDIEENDNHLKDRTENNGHIASNFNDKNIALPEKKNIDDLFDMLGVYTTYK